MGHYIACLRYGVDATRPFFLPRAAFADRHARRVHPHPSRIPRRSRCSTSASPVRSPASWSRCRRCSSACAMSRVDQAARGSSPCLVELGEPLLFKFAAWLTGADRRWLLDQPAPDGVRGVVRPAGHGAEPVSDRAARRRAHLLRRARRRSTWVTLVMIAVAIGLAFSRSSWVAWTVLLMVMIVVSAPSPADARRATSRSDPARSSWRSWRC